MSSFGDGLIERTRALGAPVVWGSIRILERIPAMFRRGSMQPRGPETARPVEESCCRVIGSMKRTL